MKAKSFLAVLSIAAFAAGACSAQAPSSPAPPGAGPEARGEAVSPMDPRFGCKGDGVADDTACFQAALTASQGKELLLGPHHYLITRNLVISGPVKILGAHAGWYGDGASCLAAGARNLNLITLPAQAAGSVLRDFCIMDGYAGPNAAGAAITVEHGTNSVKIENLWIDRPCIGIDVNGNSNTIGGALTYISGVGGAGCHGIRVGAQTLRAESADIRILNTTVQGDRKNPPDDNLLVLDAGGLTLQNDDFLYGRVGTKLAPGAGQEVDWLFASNTVLGDTTVNWALYVTTADRSAQVKGAKFDGSWTASNSSGDLVYLGNDGGGLVTDVTFSSHRFYNSPGSLITLNPGVTNTNIGGASELCGYGAYGLNLASGAGAVSVVGDRISPKCAGLNAAGRQAVNFAGSNSQINIVANDVTGNVGPNFMNGVPAGTSQVENNLPIDQNAPTVASGATLDLSATPSPRYWVSGTAPIGAITGGWQGRTVQLISMSGALAFTPRPGGNLCNAKSTSGVNDSVTAFFTGHCWLLK